MPRPTHEAWVQPVVLEGKRVGLEPLRRDHLADLSLQLSYAFEVLGANRVEFKTHARNERSRTALAGKAGPEATLARYPSS